MKITVDYLAAAAFAAYLLWDRSGTALWVLCGTVIHEAGHLAAVWLCGERAGRVELRPFAVRIVKERGSAKKEALISLAGPLAGGLAGFAFRLAGLYRAAAASWVLTGFNLLPVYPLDGWRLLDLFMSGRFRLRTVKTVEILAAVLALTAVGGLLARGVFA